VDWIEHVKLKDPLLWILVAAIIVCCCCCCFCCCRRRKDEEEEFKQFEDRTNEKEEVAKNTTVSPQAVAGLAPGVDIITKDETEKSSHVDIELDAVPPPPPPLAPVGRASSNLPQSGGSKVQVQIVSARMESEDEAFNEDEGDEI